MHVRAAGCVEPQRFGDRLTSPHLTEFTYGHILQPGYEFGDSFEVAITLILDGLERVAAAER